MTHPCHSIEATTAHLSSVGLTFEGFRAWTIESNARILITEDYDLAYPAELVREYIRKHHQL